MDYAVVLEEISKYYGSLKAVDEVTLQVEKGKLFALLGASGSGKTTMLRLIGGFEEPDQGKVILQGDDVTKFSAYKRSVHTVFQDYALFPHLSVRENVGFALRIQRKSEDVIRKRVSEALEMVRLAGFEKRFPDQLSGGQKQRVALARAVVDHPAVLLLDEPLSALDAKVRAEVREELKHLQRVTGITFVYVTHDQEEALTLGDQVAVMKGGKLLQVGTPVEIYENPSSLYVASFVGKANFLPGVLLESVEHHAKIQAYGKIVPGTLKQNALKGSKVRIMLRPENLGLSREEKEAPWEGKIMQAQYLGHATEYLVQTEEAEFRALEIRKRGSLTYQEGEKVYLSFRDEEALVYPEDG